MVGRPFSRLGCRPSWCCRSSPKEKEGENWDTLSARYRLVVRALAEGYPDADGWTRPPRLMGEAPIVTPFLL